jgi:putative transposase
MAWLLGTFSARLSRFREERGHLFQGRYQAILVEAVPALARVADYIHLKRVRAGIVLVDQIAQFRWSSLRRLVRGFRPPFLGGRDFLEARGVSDSEEGWRDYIAQMRDLAANEAEQERRGFGEMSRGWAPGRAGWRKTLAKNYLQEATKNVSRHIVRPARLFVCRAQPGAAAKPGPKSPSQKSRRKWWAREWRQQKHYCGR